MKVFGSRVTLALTVWLFSSATGFAQTTDLTVMSYNTQHAGRNSSYATVDAVAKVVINQSPRPSVLVLQESDYSMLPIYIERLNFYYGLSGATGWQGRYVRHCAAKSSTGGVCTSQTIEAVIALSLFPILDSEGHYFLYPEAYFLGGRAAVRIDVQLPDTTVAHIFDMHLQPNDADGGSRQSSRLRSVADLKTWARSFTSPKLMGGDFNASDNKTEIVHPAMGMAELFVDAWKSVGTGSGATHGKNRIDYWFDDKGGVATAMVAWVGPEHGESDHRPLLATYRITSNLPGHETPCPSNTLLCDSFEDGGLDSAKWRSTIFSGTQDTAVHSVASGETLRIGPLMPDAAGAHYNGIQTFGQRDMSNSSVYAQLLQAPSSTSTAYAMFTVGNDTENFYRFFVSAGVLTVERKVESVKTDFGPFTFTPGDFLRLRHDGGNAVFEVAPNAGGLPGVGTVVHSEPWDSHVPRTQLNFELKAGTSAAETAPGTVLWGPVLWQVTQAPPGETVLLSDAFNGTTLDITNKWSNTLVSSGQDTHIPLLQNDRLEIGDMLASATGSHYNGITSKFPYNFTDAYAYVRVAGTSPTDTRAQWFFTMPADADNHYRVYISGAFIYFEKKVAGVKTTVGSGPYDQANDSFVRLRHDAASHQVVLEASPNTGGVPSGWSSPFAAGVANSTSDSVAVTALRFELKAGTDRAQANPPGTLAFDSFRAARWSQQP